jgi:hypothetical protein
MMPRLCVRRERALSPPCKCHLVPPLYKHMYTPRPPPTNPPLCLHNRCPTSLIYLTATNMRLADRSCCRTNNSHRVHTRSATKHYLQFFASSGSFLCCSNVQIRINQNSTSKQCCCFCCWWLHATTHNQHSQDILVIKCLQMGTALCMT